MAPIRISATHFSSDTVEFFRLLHQHSVRYLVVGGEAVIFHGLSRLTGDVDFFFDRSAENAQDLFAALLEFWEGDIPGLKSVADLLEPGLVVQFGVPPNRIDLLNAIDGVAFGEAWGQRETALLMDEDSEVPIQFIGLDSLIENKETAGRPKDMEDLQYLRHKQRS